LDCFFCFFCFFSDVSRGSIYDEAVGWCYGLQGASSLDANLLKDVEQACLFEISSVAQAVKALVVTKNEIWKSRLMKLLRQLQT
jgi:hypothetical protein